MGFIRKLTNWFRYRKRRKLWRLRNSGEFRKEIKQLFPNSESPLMGLTKTMGKIPPADPRFRFLHSILGKREE